MNNKHLISHKKVGDTYYVTILKDTIIYEAVWSRELIIWNLF